jgi:hypothetical protein
MGVPNGSRVGVAGELGKAFSGRLGALILAAADLAGTDGFYDGYQPYGIIRLLQFDLNPVEDELC